MTSRLDRRAKHGGRSPRHRFQSECDGAAPRRDPHLGRNGCALIDSRFAVESAEHADRIVSIFRRTEEKVTCPLQGKVECEANLALHLPVEIDEDVATADEIDARKWRILEKAVPGDQHCVAQ